MSLADITLTLLSLIVKATNNSLLNLVLPRIKWRCSFKECSTSLEVTGGRLLNTSSTSCGDTSCFDKWLMFPESQSKLIGSGRISTQLSIFLIYTYVNV